MLIVARFGKSVKQNSFVHTLHFQLVSVVEGRVSGLLSMGSWLAVKRVVVEGDRFQHGKVCL